MEVQPRNIKSYLTEDNECPFANWFNGLKDPLGKAQIDKRLARLRLGAFGEWDDVGEGVIELIFKGKGPGYRIYIGQDGPIIVVLICGGTKQDQQSDIDRAKRYWRDYKS